MTRTGKVARLPKKVRQQLNLRMGDGEPGTKLVAWLNGLAEVKAVLERDFGGRAVTEQNLSEWKQGGFIDWQRHPETLESLRLTAEQAQELTSESEVTPLSDVLSASVTLIREWTRLRSADQRAARLQMQQRDWVRGRNRQTEEAARELEEAERELAEAEAELERARAHAESPEGQMEAFEKAYKAVDLQVVKETMDAINRDNLFKVVCDNAKASLRQWLR